MIDQALEEYEKFKTDMQRILDFCKTQGWSVNYTIEVLTLAHMFTRHIVKPKEEDIKIT